MKLESSDGHFKLESNHSIVVTFRDAYRDKKLFSTLEKLNDSYPNAIFIDMGWPTLNFKPSNIVRTFGSSAIASEATAWLLSQ